MKSISTLALVVALSAQCLSAQASLVNLGDGTVKDTVTNLIWLQNWNVNGLQNWATQKAWAENLSFAGSSDWVLPNISDYATLFAEVGDLTRVSVFTNVQPQPNVYWSSTELVPGGLARFFGANQGLQNVGDENAFRFFGVAVRPGDVAAPVAAIPQKKPPQWLKNLALSYEDLFKKTAHDLAIETSLIGGVITWGERGIVKGLEYALEGLAELYGAETLAKLLNQSNTPGAINGFLIGQGELATYNCLNDLASMHYETALALCGANFTGLIMDQYLAPKLHAYGIDPPANDYQSIFPVAIPSINIGNSMYQPLVNNIACAGAYLDGVNQSYDRYSAAYAANDLFSEDLQWDTLNNYLAQYGSCMLKAKNEFSSIGDAIENSAVLNASYDPNFLAQVQDLLQTEGFGAEIIASLQNMGLDSTQIDQVKGEILAFNPLSISGRLSDAFATEATMFGALAVPTPGTFPLMILGLLAIRLTQGNVRRKR